jgi:predicted RNase H-like HicB family nuclease
MNRRYAVVYEKGPTSYGASVPDLPGCIAVGETFEEVSQLIQEAIEFHLEGLKLHGDPIPEPSTEVGYAEIDMARVDANVAAERQNA